MKLSGSLTEQLFREEFLNSNIATKDSHDAKKILSFLITSFCEVSSAYSLYWILDQDLEVIEILVNGSFVVTLEIKRVDKNMRIVKEISVDEYKIGLKKKDQIKLLVAIDLAEKSK